MAKAWKKYPPIEAAWAERQRIYAEAAKTIAEGVRLRQEGLQMRTFNLSSAKSDKVMAEGDLLCFTGSMRRTDSDRLYAEAVCAVNETAVIDWHTGSFSGYEEIP